MWRDRWRGSNVTPIFDGNDESKCFLGYFLCNFPLEGEAPRGMTLFSKDEIDRSLNVPSALGIGALHCFAV